MSIFYTYLKAYNIHHIWAPFTLKSDELYNFLNTCRMATPLRGCKLYVPTYTVTSHGMVFKVVNPGINYHFYINPKNTGTILPFRWPALVMVTVRRLCRPGRPPRGSRRRRLRSQRPRVDPPCVGADGKPRGLYYFQCHYSLCLTKLHRRPVSTPVV